MSIEWEGMSLGYGHAKAQSEKALLVELHEHGELWIPKSQIHDDSEVYSLGHDGDVVVTLWWAEKRELV